MKHLAEEVPSLELDRRLAAAKPVQVEVSRSAIAHTVAVARTESLRRAPRARIAWAAAVLALCVGTVGVTPATAAGIRWIATQVGWAPVAGGEVLADSEWVALSAPALEQCLDEVFPRTLPLAPQSSQASIVNQVARENSAMGGIRQAVGLQSRMEQLVLDGWLVELADARSGNDRARVAAAVAVVQVAPEWPATAATAEPHWSDLVHALICAHR